VTFLLAKGDASIYSFCGKWKPHLSVVWVAEVSSVDFGACAPYRQFVEFLTTQIRAETNGNNQIEIREEIPMSKRTVNALLVLACMFVMQGMLLYGQAAQPAQTQSSTVSDADIQLMREDIRSQKKQIVAANLQLTDAEAVKFWPVYDAYTQEVIKINDQRYALIKEYAQTYDTMTDAQAKSLIKRWAATDSAFVNLRTQWMPKFEAVLPGKKAALFFQIDRRLGLLIDLQLASMIPMVKQ
jgi:hypothetical protein